MRARARRRPRAAAAQAAPARMTPRVSVVVPVMDGARYLAELLAARARARRDDEVLVDRLGLARRLGGDRPRAPAPRCSRSRRRTSATAARATSAPSAPRGELDLLPHPGRDAAARLARRLRRGVRARRATSARRSARTCRGRTRQPDDRARADRVLRRRSRRRRAPRVLGRGDPTFLSNVNACYRRGVLGARSASTTSPTRGPGVRPRAAAHAGWRKAYHPRRRRCCTRTTTRRSSSCAATSTSTAGCARRSATSSGSACARRCATSAGSSPSDRRWMREQGMRRGDRARAGPAARSCTTPAARCSRRSASRAAGCPRRVQRALSLEGRADGAHAAVAAPPAPDLPAATHQPPRHAAHGYEAIVRVIGATGPAPLLDPVPGHGRPRAAARRVRRSRRSGAAAAATTSSSSSCCGSSGWGTRARSGSTTRSTSMRRAAADAPRQRASSTSRPSQAPVYRASTTGTAPTSRSPPAGRPSSRCSSCTGVRARAYLVNDHEPEFYATSAESIWATETYRQGLYGIAGSPWLRDLYIDRYGGAAEAFQFGVDHDVYRPRPVAPARRHDRLLRARRSRRAAPSARRAGARRSCKRAPPGRAHRAVRRPRAAGHAVPVRAPRRRDARAARLGVLGGDRRAVPVADQLLADPAGDARLRAAVRRPGGRERELGVRRRRAGRARAVRRRRARRRARAAARRPAPSASAARRRAATSSRPHTWDQAAVQVERGLRAALRLREEG